MLLHPYRYDEYSSLYYRKSKSSVSSAPTFTSSWKTDNTSTGSSNDNQVKLPLIAGYTLNFLVNWGDGNSDTITAYDQAEVTHTYASIGTYTITITGTIEGFRFNNTGDKLKLLDISEWGPLKLGTNEGNYFHGCTNFNISATDTLDTASMTSMHQMFFNCSSLNGAINFSDTSSVNTMRQMFYSCFSFNQDVSGLVTSAVTTFYGMFFNCTALDPNISGWDIALVTTMQYMLSGTCAISDSNYSVILIAWNAKSHQDTVTLDVSASYEAGAVAARDDFVNNHGWTINDGGPA